MQSPHILPARPLARLGALAVLIFTDATFGPPCTGAFTITKATFSGGAVATAGESFRLGATCGEAGVVGTVSGGSFRLLEGFWQPNMGIAISKQPPPQELASLPIESIRYVNAYTANLPCPFRDAMTISFSVAVSSPTSLVIYDVGGRRVRTLVNDMQAPGRHQMRWDGRDDHGVPIASGLCFVRLTIGPWSETRRVMCIR